jgi:hypothetical protein
MTTPEPNVPVERSLPEPAELATELDAPEEAPEMAAQPEAGDRTVEPDER